MLVSFFLEIGFYVNWCAVEVLEDSGLKKNQVDEIVLVGGSTRIPKVQQLIKVGGNPGRPKYAHGNSKLNIWTPQNHIGFFLNCVCSSTWKDFQTLILESPSLINF